MRSLGIAAVLVIVLVFATIPSFLGTAAAQSGTASLSGIVCPSTDSSQPKDGSAPRASCYGQGLPGASVHLTKPGILPSVNAYDQTVTTSDGGKYSFGSLAAGNYTLAVSRTGFSSSSEAISISGGAAQQHDVPLTGQSVQASGRVSDPNGGAIAGADVTFCCQTASAEARSGPDGQYSLQLIAGYWSVSAQASGFQGFSEYVLVDGSDLPIQMQPVPPPDATLHGTVADQDGNPVPGARVTASNYGGGCGYATPASDGSTTASPEPMRPCYASPYGGQNFTESDAQGHYVLGVYAGTNQVGFQKDGYAPFNTQVQVGQGDDVQQDLAVQKYPEKTAHITGRITDGATGKAVRIAYLNVDSPEYGLSECSSQASQSSGSGTSSPGAEPMSIRAPGPYPNPGCAITVQDDGTYSGDVSPGYAVVSVWVDSYSACASSQDADGSSSRTCGPEYFAWSKSLTLPANATTTLDIALRQRPGPDATISGYLVDAKTGKAIAGGQVSFSNQDTYAYGAATTDQDGSYKLRLRSGYHTVYAYAPGHLHWEGVLDVAKGDGSFDVLLQPGNEAYGGCCYYAEGDKAVASSAGVAAPTPQGAGSSGGAVTGASASNAAQGGAGQHSEAYTDLGGGLGPYDAAARSHVANSGAGSGATSTSKGSPGPGLLLVGAALALVVLARRRLA